MHSSDGDKNLVPGRPLSNQVGPLSPRGSVPDHKTPHSVRPLRACRSSRVALSRALLSSKPQSCISQDFVPLSLAHARSSLGVDPATSPGRLSRSFSDDDARDNYFLPVIKCPRESSLRSSLRRDISRLFPSPRNRFQNFLLNPVGRS